jgi:LDH2 family malate/lactate/ureidoglycolate dehydrogenase
MLKLKTISMVTIGLLSTTAISGFDWNGNYCDTEYEYTSQAVIWTINPDTFIDMNKSMNRMQREVDYAKLTKNND